MKLVLLPGLHGDAKLFEPLLAKLPDQFDTHIISYPAGIKLNYQQLLNLVLSQLPDQEYVLLGESFSGPLVYQVAFSNPEKLKAVIFVASFLDNPRPLLLNAFTIATIGLLKTLPLPLFVIKACLTGSIAGKHILAQCKQILDNLLPGLVTFRLTEITRLRKRHWPCQCPAVYIQATDDKLVPHQCIQAFKKTFANLTIKSVVSDHFVLQTQPNACAKIIIESLNQLSHDVPKNPSLNLRSVS